MLKKYKYCSFCFLFSLTLLLGCRQDFKEWEEGFNDTQDRLHDVAWLGDSTAIAVGGVRFSREIILRTSDAGATWDTFPTQLSNKMLFCTAFKNPTTGFVGSLDGRILKTEDGGLSWSTYQLMYWQPVLGIAWADENVAVGVCGDGYGRGQIVRTTDAGQSWYQVDSSQYALTDICFLDSLHGFLCGYGTLKETWDGGKTWAFREVDGDFFTALDFPTGLVGYVVGRTGSIYKTANAGKTWERLRNGNIPVQPLHHFNDVKFLTANEGYIVGDKGLVWKTEDGGRRWSPFVKKTKQSLFGISFDAQGNRWLVGDDGLLSRFEE